MSENKTVSIYTSGDLNHIFHEPSRDLTLIFPNFFLKWNDSRLTWNTSEYMAFFFSPNTKVDIWRPTVRTWEVGLYENATSIVITYDGNVFISAIIRMRARCQPQASYSVLPDTFRCFLVLIMQPYLRFKCIGYSGLRCLLGGKTMTLVPPGGMWAITGISADPPEPFFGEEVTQLVWITLERRAEDRTMFHALFAPFAAALAAGQHLMPHRDEARLVLNAVLTLTMLKAWLQLQGTISFRLLQRSLLLNLAALLWVVFSWQLSRCGWNPPARLKSLVIKLAFRRAGSQEVNWKEVAILVDRLFFLVWLLLFAVESVQRII